ncbi:hypothetical protein [Nitrosopumilus piranensis]|uniref:Uncharacterized protein n=1 Tax=Nitrosopumilus piranensis TaxID=1582439 RepID=A0A0C5BSN9_9ARCH|nr:hypothetical protein [Nitrosopumilus piranensis]AJM92798.1 hypothetical protein NPIRD3C_1586 [Nitrosopumilus piranensis]
MKYKCKECDFHWIGTSYTFDEVRKHEKTHLKSKVKTIKPKISNTQNKISKK